MKALTAALTALSVAGSAATLSGAFATLTAMVLVLKTATELLGKLFAPEDDSKYGYRNDSAKLGAEGKIYYARDIETVNKARRERALEAYDKQLGYFGYDVYNPTGKQKPTEQNIETVNININAADKSPEDIAEAVNEKLIEGRT